MTQSLGLGEVAVEAAKAKLQTYIPGRLATINAEKADGIEIAVPAESDYYTSGINAMPSAPALIIAEAPSTFREEGAHSLMADMQLLVYCFEQDVDRQILGKRLQRLARATIEALWDDEPREALDPLSGVYHLRPQNTIPGRTFEPDDDNVNWRSFFICVFSLTQYEGD